MEEPLRLAPEAYGATIGPAVRGARTTRLSAVCAALVSLLAVCCVVLSSSAGDSQRDMTMKGLPGFELSLRSAMETWLQNSEKREQEHAAAQRLAMQRLAARQAGQHVVFHKEKRVTRSKREAGVASATAEAMQALRDTHPVKSDHATKTALQFFPIPAEPEKTSPGAGVIAFHVKRISNVPDDVADVALRNHMTVEDVVAQKGGDVSSTAPKKENTLPFFGTGREEPPDRADNKEMKAKMEGLASKPAKGLVNQPWNAPSSDFLAASQAQAKTTEFDVPVPNGLHAGGTFLAEIPGHREREVTVPAGVKPGQLLSVQVPSATKLTEEASGSTEETSVSSNNAAGEAAAAGAVLVATVEAKGGTLNNDFSTVPVVFGGTPEQQAAANAVNAVHDLFHKEQVKSKKWVPGDTQPLPTLMPLGQTTTDHWTSDPSVYGDMTGLHAQSCAARCGECKKMGGNYYCQKCSDVCSQVYEAEEKLTSYSWKPGDPRGVIDPITQAILPTQTRFFRAVTKEEAKNMMKQPMIPAKKRYYQKTTQVTHVNPAGITQIVSQPEWPVQSTPYDPQTGLRTAGLSALANLYKPGSQLPSNLPTLSSLETVEGRQYKRSLMEKQQKQQILAEENPTTAENGGEQTETPEKRPGFIVAAPDDQGLEHGAVSRKMTTNVNVIGPGGPTFVQIHTEPAENPQHFGAYLRPHFRSEYPITKTITVNPTRSVIAVNPRPVIAVGHASSTSVVNMYQPASMAAKQQTIQTTMGTGGLMFQVPAAPGMVLAPGTAYSQTTTVNREQPQWGAPSVSSTTVTTAAQGAPVQYVQASPPLVRYIQRPATAPVQYVQAPHGGWSSETINGLPPPPSTPQFITQASFVPPALRAGAIRVVGAVRPSVQVVNKDTAPTYQSLSPIPKLNPMPFFDKKRREKDAIFRHWDGKEMKVLNVLPVKNGEVNLDPESWQGQNTNNVIVSEGSAGESADKKFSEAIMQIQEGMHAAANSELHFKGKDRTTVGYREYGDVNPAIGEPADPTRGGPKLITNDPFGLRDKEAVSPLASINDRAGAVPTGSKLESMVVKVPAGLSAGQKFTALTGAGHEEEVIVPQGVKAGGEVEISVPVFST